MPRASGPKVVILSAAGTLVGVDPLLRKARVRVSRLPALVITPVLPQRWLRRLATSPLPDAVIVSSRPAVTFGVRPWRKLRNGQTHSVEFWAIGPGTAAALRASGVPSIRRPKNVSTEGLLHSLTGTPARRVLYFRSDRAGPALARQLRERGYRVAEVVAYRVRAPSRLAPEARQKLSDAHLLVATSPSSLSSLRRILGPTSFQRLRRRTRLVVLGERSRRAAQGHGFRQVAVAPYSSAQRFTRQLLRELRNAPA
jgi:uroporphyrinogen-III synthase